MAQTSDSTPSDKPAGTGVPAGPAADPVGNVLDLLKQVAAILAAVLLPSLPNRNKVLKVRRAAEKLIPEWLQLAVNKPVYAPLGSDPAALLREWDLVSRLLLLLTPVNGLRKGIGDTVAQKEAGIWKTVLTIYTLASANPGGDRGWKTWSPG